jgi:hypothetical protein
MIKKSKKYILALLFALSFPTVLVYASSPLLNLSPTGDGNNVTVTITNADGNTPVVLFYSTILGTGTQSQTLGSTDNTGRFSTTISTSAYGITTTSQVYALINGYQTPSTSWPYSTASAITFSQTNPTITLGQNLVLTLSGATGNYFVSANSNQNALQASVAGNVLSLYGIAGGTAVLTVCAANNVCSNETVIVTSNNTTSTAPTISQNTVTVAVGQNTQIVASNGAIPYSIFYDGTNKVTAAVNGSAITITGVNAGTTSVSVCSISGGCTPVYITVTVANAISNPSSIFINIPLSVGQTMIMPLTGGTGSYYIANPIATPFNASISVNSLYIKGVAVGSNTVSVCSNATTCSVVSVAVGPSIAVSTPTTATPGASVYYFSNPLSSGMRGSEVLKLQKRLELEEYLTVTPNGYFGTATLAAVKAYQRAHGLSPLGIVGPGTRAELNK